MQIENKRPSLSDVLNMYKISSDFKGNRILSKRLALPFCLYAVSRISFWRRIFEIFFKVPSASLEDIFFSKYSFRDFESWSYSNIHIMLSVDWKNQLAIARLIDV